MVQKVFGTSSKWAESIKYQLNDIESSIINTRFINLEQVILDPNNHRTISCSLEDIKNGPKLPKEEFNEDTQISFEKSVQNYFKNCDGYSNKIKDYMELANLAVSIKTPDNLINPITVYLDNNMFFNLIAGHRRTLAHYLIESKKISARILPKKPSELDKNLLQWSENQDRENLTLSDQLSAISKIIVSWEKENNTKISLARIITLLSIKKTKAIWFLKLYRTQDPEILDLIHKGAVSSLETAYKIACIPNKEEKLLAVTGILNGEIKNAKFITRKKEELKTKNTKQHTADKIGGRSKFKIDTINISIKSKENLNFFQHIIRTLNNVKFFSTLSEKDKQLWETFNNYFREKE